MAVITDISVQKNNKKRCNVYLDGEFSFGVSIDVAYKYNLKKGMEISEKQKNDILCFGEYDSAFSKATDYLSKTLKTKRQMITYLLGKGYNEDIVYKVIDKLKEIGLVNDIEYVKRYAESTKKNQGKKLISYKLMSKGIRKEDIENAISDVNVDFVENAQAVFEKYMKNKEFSKENILKASRYLYGRGFSFEEIDSVLSKYKDD